MERKGREKQKANVRTGSARSKKSSEDGFVRPEPIIPSSSEEEVQEETTKSSQSKSRGRSLSPEYGIGKLNREDRDSDEQQDFHSDDDEMPDLMSDDDEDESGNADPVGSGGYPGYGQSSGYSTPPAAKNSSSANASDSSSRKTLPQYKVVRKFDVAEGKEHIYERIASIVRGDLSRSGYALFVTDNNPIRRKFEGWTLHNVSDDLRS
jgi:hypothetical protein